MATSSLDWSDILAYFCLSSTVNGKSGKKCPVKTLDTVYFATDTPSIHWHYTNKSGNVSKKKPENSSILDISTRFSKFALANPLNTNKLVATKYSSDGQELTMNATQFTNFLSDTANIEKLKSSGDYLQAYLRPQNGEDIVFVCHSMEENGSYSHDVTAMQRLDRSQQLKSSLSKVNDQITQLNDEIIKCLSHNLGATIVDIQAEYVVDDNSHAWLSRVLRCEVRETSSSHETAADATTSQTSSPSPAKSGSGITQPKHKQHSLGHSQSTRVGIADMGVSNSSIPREVASAESQPRSRSASTALPNKLRGVVSEHQARDEQQSTQHKTQASGAQPAQPSSSVAEKTAAAYSTTSGSSTKLGMKKDILERKKKKKDKTSGPNNSGTSSEGSGFRRSKLDAPPSYELMAKFAAEKEWNEKQLQQQLNANDGDEDNEDDDDESWVVDNHARVTGGGAPQYSSSALAKQQLRQHTGGNSKGKKKGSPKRQKQHQQPQHQDEQHCYSSGNKNNNLSPIMDVNEKRLAELERLAASTATIKSHFHQQSGNALLLPLGANGYPLASTQVHSSIGPRSVSNMSNTEADFLVRQINTADVSQLSLFSNLDEFETVPQINNPHHQGGGGGSVFSAQHPSHSHGESLASTTGQSAHSNSNNNSNNNSNSNIIGTTNPKDIVASAFTERIANLERQVVSLQGGVDKKESEIEKRDTKLRKLTVELESCRREAQNDLKRLQSEHEVEILRIREQHAKDKALLTAATGATVNTSQQEGSPSRDNTNSASSSKLIEQLESLRLEQRRLQESFADERRSMQIDYSNKVLLQERKMKAEIMELKSNTAVLEDRIVTNAEELSAALSTIQQLKGVNAQLDLAKREAVDQQNRLRADIKNMQQSVQASYRLETSQNLYNNSSDQSVVTGGTDPESTMRLNDAKNEAKTRQLTNKIEFLKSQLEAEKKCSDELKVGMDATKAKLDEIREEFKYRMQEAERIKLLAVEEAETRVEMQFEERMREFTTLQSRVLNLQGQLQDVSTEHLVAKQAEEKQKQAAMKQLAIASALKTELEQQRAVIAQLREEKELETIKDSAKSNHDAVIRRLDNERQYLKSQLTSEITHKNEMQIELNKCSAQNKEIQKQWNDDVLALKDVIATEAQKVKDRESQFRQIESSQQTELETHKHQLRELKDGFVKARDSLRMEQLNCENAVTASRRLTEQLELANADIAQLKAQDQQSAEAYRQQIEVINAAIRETEAQHKKELSTLRDELKKQYLANSDDQSHIMDIREQHQAEKFIITRQVHTTKMVGILSKWRLSRIYTAFRVWNTNTTLVNVAGQFRVQVEDMLKNNTEELNLEQTQALEAQAKRLKKEHSVAVALLKHEFETQMEEARVKAGEDKQNALDAAYSEHQSQIAQMESDFAFDLAIARKEAASELQKLSEEREAQYAALKEKHAEATQVAKELAYERLLKAEEEKEEEMNALWAEKLAAHEADLAAQHQKAMETLQMDHDCQLHSKHEEHKQKMADLTAKHELQLQITVEGLEATHQQATEEALVAKEQEMKQFEVVIREEEEIKQQKQRAEMHEATESRIRELRELWQVEFDERMSVNAQEFEAKLAEKMEEYSKSVEAEKQRAVKLEASKWKQAMKDLEQTNEVSALKVRAETIQQKDAEFKLEMEKANNRFEQQKKAEYQVHLQFIEDIKNDHALALERQTNSFELQCEELRLEVETAVKMSQESLWNEKLKHILQESEVSWRNKVAKEKDRSDALKNELVQKTSQFASECTKLRQAVISAEEQAAAREEEAKVEIAQLKQDFQAEREAYQSQRREEEEQQRLAFDGEKAALVAELESKYNEQSEKALAAETDRLSAEFERQMGGFQEESERLVTSLEAAMAGLKEEKTQLSNQLESLTVKLEDTEDALYDQQQENKKAVKEASLTLWRTATSVLQMKQRYSKGMEEFDAEAKRRHEGIRREMQGRLNESTLLAMKLTALLQEVESNRKKSHSVLTSYKHGEIAQKRKDILLLERELERITLERDSFEEQREVLESDVAQLESQVRELEDHIREHNRESSMTNGRINVAHARKKRRLDSELERMLESIESKRMNMNALDERVAEKTRLRDEKELDMIDTEKQLVSIILEQQKQVLGHLDESRAVEDKCKTLVNVAKLPYPVPAVPTMTDVLSLLAEQRMKHGDELA